MLDRVLLGASSSTPPGPGTYFLSSLNGAAIDAYTNVGVDDNNNTYVSGYNEKTVYELAAVKYDKDGNVQWKTNLTSGTNIYWWGGVVNNGDLYCAGTDNTDGMIVKYNSSGVLQWQQRLTGVRHLGNGAVDSNGDIYIVGYVSSTSTITIVKINSSGTLLWQRQLPASYAAYAYGVACDSTNNVYVSGFAADSASVHYSLLVKYNSSGTLQWQRGLTSATTNMDARGCAVDSNNDIYMSLQVDNTLTVVKYNSSGTLQWQRQISHTNFTSTRDVGIYSANNVYLAGAYYDGTNFQTLILKYNSSGTLQWQRRIGTSTTSTIPLDIKISGDACYLVGQISNDGFLAKLPIDGSKTGTYTLNGTSIVYEATSFTVTTSSMSDLSRSLSSSSLSVFATSLQTGASSSTSISTTVI